MIEVAKDFVGAILLAPPACVGWWCDDVAWLAFVIAFERRPRVLKISVCYSLNGPFRGG